MRSPASKQASLCLYVRWQLPGLSAFARPSQDGRNKRGRGHSGGGAVHALYVYQGGPECQFILRRSVGRSDGGPGWSSGRE